MPITHFPSELLELIFHEVSDGKPVISPIAHSRRTKRELSSSKLACKHWRSIICALDQFYVITCSFDGSNGTPQLTSTYAKWMLESQNCDLDIEILGWFHDNIWRTWRLPEDYISIDFAKPFRSQWRLLIIRGLNFEVSQMMLADLSSTGPLPRLTELVVDAICNRRQNKDTVAELPAGLLSLDAASLKDLNFANCDYDTSWPSSYILHDLRSLTMSLHWRSRIPSPEVVAKLLGDADALSYLSLNFHANVDRNVQLESFCVHLPRLATLDLTISSAYAARMLLKLDLSNLQTFTCQMGEFDPSSEEILARYPEEAIQLHRLRDFNLTTHHCTEALLLLRLLEAPHLQILRVEATSGHGARVQLDNQRLRFQELRQFSLTAFGEDMMRILQYIHAPNLDELALVLVKRTMGISWPFEHVIRLRHPFPTVEMLDLSLEETLGENPPEPGFEELQGVEGNILEDQELINHPPVLQYGGAEPTALPLPPQQFGLRPLPCYPHHANADVGAENHPDDTNAVGGGVHSPVQWPGVPLNATALGDEGFSDTDEEESTRADEHSPSLELLRLLPKGRLRSLTIRNQPGIWPHVVYKNRLEMRRLLAIHLSFDDENWKRLLTPLGSRDLANVQVLRLDANVPSGSLDPQSFSFLWSTVEASGTGGEVEIPLQSLTTLQVLLPERKGETGFMQELRNLLIMRKQLGHSLERLEVSPPPPSPYYRQSLAQYVRYFEGYEDADSFPS